MGSVFCLQLGSAVGGRFYQVFGHHRVDASTSHGQTDCHMCYGVKGLGYVKGYDIERFPLKLYRLDIIVWDCYVCQNTVW